MRSTGVAGESFRDTYDATVEAERARQKEVEEKNRALSTLLQFGGSLGGTGALLKAAPYVGNMVFGNIGSTLSARVRAGAISGGAGGAVQEFGAREGSLQDRGENMWKGVPFSAGIGAALPAAGHWARKGYEHLPLRAPAPTAARIDQGISSPYAGAVAGPLADMYVRPLFPFLR